MSASYDMIGRPTFYTPITENPIVDQAPPGTFDDAVESEQENTEPIVTREESVSPVIDDNSHMNNVCIFYNKDMGKGKKEVKQFTTDKDAIIYAKENIYQMVVKLPRGKYYFKYKQTGHPLCKTYHRIIEGMSPCSPRKAWVIRY
jgi:hypothetical protein